MSLNVLVLSAGRRVELIKRFKRAATELKLDSRVIAVDINDMAPAIYFADSFYIIPRIDDAHYIDTIVEICKKENISVIIPTIDTELIKLSVFHNYIENNTHAKLLLSEQKVIEICCDKKKSQTFFKNNGFGIPYQLSDQEIRNGWNKFPLFIKPVDGSSSINAFKINNTDELKFFVNYIDKPIVQEYVEGTEYSVDVFCDFEGNPITIVPRIRLAMRSGEIMKGKIDKDRDIIEDVFRLISVLKPIGQITIQCMKSNDGIKYIEINPRFGGGSPMSIDAGADSCKNIYKLLMGAKLKYNEDYDNHHLFLRFDSSIELDENMVLKDDKSSSF